MTKIGRKIYIIGINSFEFEVLPKKFQTLFFAIDNVAAPDSYFEKIKAWQGKNIKKKKNFFSSKSDEKLIHWIKSQTKDVILISRGDPLWFGIGRVLLENFSKEELIFYPSHTCLQLAFSKLKAPWQDTTTLSIHGRDSTKLIKTLKSKPESLAIITDSNKNSLEIIRSNLLELNLGESYDFWLCEEIGFKNERIRKLKINDKLPLNISSLNIVVLLKKLGGCKNHVPLFGLKDETFKTFEDRPNLLTKREIRVQILADLELPEKGLIWDIGAGCGTIGLEALKLRPNLKLFCIDKRIGTKSLISENAKRLSVKPQDIFEAEIIDLLNTRHINYLKDANRVVIGGCDKKTKLLLIDFFSQTMKSGDIIVIPMIDIQSLRELREALGRGNFKTSLNLIQTYKSISISEGIRLDPNNPVFILKGVSNSG